MAPRGRLPKRPAPDGGVSAKQPKIDGENVLTVERVYIAEADKPFGTTHVN